MSLMCSYPMLVSCVFVDIWKIFDLIRITLSPSCYYQIYSWVKATRSFSSTMFDLNCSVILFDQNFKCFYLFSPYYPFGFHILIFPCSGFRFADIISCSIFPLTVFFLIFCFDGPWNNKTLLHFQDFVFTTVIIFNCYLVFVVVALFNDNNKNDNRDNVKMNKTI